MPSVSKKQHNFFEMIAHDPGAAKRVGVPQKVGEDFSQADKGHKIGRLPLRVGMVKKPGSK